MKKFIAVTAIALVTVTGCNGSGGSNNVEDKGAPISNCKQEDTGGELFVKETYNCGDSMIRVFEDKVDRENWKQIAVAMGSVVTEEGEWWVRTDT